MLFVAILAGANARCSLARGRYQRGRVQFPNSDDSVWCTMPPSGQVIHYELQFFNNKTLFVLTEKSVRPRILNGVQNFLRIL